MLLEVSRGKRQARLHNPRVIHFLIHITAFVALVSLVEISMKGTLQGKVVFQLVREFQPSCEVFRL